MYRIHITDELVSDVADRAQEALDESSTPWSSEIISGFCQLAGLRLEERLELAGLVKTEIWTRRSLAGTLPEPKLYPDVPNTRVFLSDHKYVVDERRTPIISGADAWDRWEREHDR